MAALLFVVAWGLIDVAEMRRVFRANRGDAVVLVVTFVSTLTLQLEFAIFVGVLVSLLVYLHRTTRPRVVKLARRPPLTPHEPPPTCASTARCSSVPSTTCCDRIETARREHPNGSPVILVATAVNFVDVAGAEMIAQLARELRSEHRKLCVCGLKPQVREVLERADVLDIIGRDRLFDTEDEALHALRAEALDKDTR